MIFGQVQPRKKVLLCKTKWKRQGIGDQIYEVMSKLFVEKYLLSTHFLDELVLSRREKNKSFWDLKPFKKSNSVSLRMIDWAI